MPQTPPSWLRSHRAASTPTKQGEWRRIYRLSVGQLAMYKPLWLFMVIALRVLYVPAHRHNGGGEKVYIAAVL